MITVERDGAFLNYIRDGHVFYDPAIPSPADSSRFYRHMLDKTWFTDELKKHTARLVLEWWGDSDA